EGATPLRTDETGNLSLSVPAAGGREAGEGAGAAESGTLVEAAPVAWQAIEGRPVSVDVRYVLAEDGSVGFELGAYDPAYPLTLDPTLVYSTYLGGSRFEDDLSIALDSSGNVFLSGTTASKDFPTTAGAYDLNPGSEATFEAFVAKLNPKNPPSSQLV